MVRADSFVSGHGADELWSLVSRPGYIDTAALWNALAALGGDAELDYRSRLLVHESMDALATRWGADRLRMELRGALGAETLQKLWLKDFGEVGFPRSGQTSWMPPNPTTSGGCSESSASA